MTRLVTWARKNLFSGPLNTVITVATAALIYLVMKPVLVWAFTTARWDVIPRTARILLRLDPSSVNASGDFPLAWAQAFGAGRTYYNALGHFDATWRDARFQRQLAGALRWAGRRS